jgi:hypothetical protein
VGIGTGVVGCIDSEGRIMEHQLDPDARPHAIVAGNRGDLWFTEWGANRIGHLDALGTITEIDLPTAGIRTARPNRGSREVAQRVWIEMPKTRVHGFRWWSYWRPQWTIVVLWSADTDAPWFPDATVVDVTPLAMDSPAVLVAADVLPRGLGSSR